MISQQLLTHDEGEEVTWERELEEEENGGQKSQAVLLLLLI